MQLSDQIHIIDGVRGANSYLYIEPGAAALIDTGMPGNAERILDYIRVTGLKPEDLRYIVLTHADVDHSGSAKELREITGAKVAIHSADAVRIEGKTKLKEVKGPFSFIFNIANALISFQNFEPDILIKDSDSLLGLKVVHTPGHTEGSVCLYREKEAIFVGDALRTTKKGSPKLPPSFLSINMQQAKESVRRISALEYRLLLPGHGRPITIAASEKVRKLVR
ncbi:MAG: MBL fold metallo-hydrolase [Conexivisphaerales archaeon]